MDIDEQIFDLRAEILQKRHDMQTCQTREWKELLRVIFDMMIMHNNKQEYSQCDMETAHISACHESDTSTLHGLISQGMRPTNWSLDEEEMLIFLKSMTLSRKIITQQEDSDRWIIEGEFRNGYSI